MLKFNSTKKSLGGKKTNKTTSNETMKENANYNSLSLDIILWHIAPYLDSVSLMAYAMLNKIHLKLLKTALEQRLPQLPLKLVTNLCRTFLITNTGNIYGTGYNHDGQLGLGDHETRYYFTHISTLPSNIREVISYTVDTFFINETELYACSGNGRGLGLGPKPKRLIVPTKMSHIPGKLKSVTASGSHTFFLTDTGLFACGGNQDGRLGVGDKEPRHHPTPVKGISEPITHLIMHDSHTLALSDTRSYVCHAYTDQSFIEIKRFPGILQNISIGGHQSHYLTDQGLYSWGVKHVSLRKNTRDNSELHEEFIEIKGLLGVILQVKDGQAHTFILTDQALYSGGDNSHGQLGQGSGKGKLDFTEVKGIKGTILQIVLGDKHSFVLTDQGLYACGLNMSGQLGLGDYKNRNVFTKIKDIYGTIQQIYAGENHTFLVTDKGLYACGNCAAGKFGIGPVGKNAIISSVKVTEPFGSLCVNSFVPVKEVPEAVINQWQSYQQCQRLIKIGLALEKQGFFAVKPTSSPNKPSEAENIVEGKDIIVNKQLSFPK